MVWLEAIPKMWHKHDGYGQNGFRVPDIVADPTPIKGSFRIKRTSKGEEYITINDCEAFVWNGEPVEEYTD